MIVISSKYVDLPEFRYICDVVFSRWYAGHNVSLVRSDLDGYKICYKGGTGLIFESPFFREMSRSGLTTKLLDIVKVLPEDIPERFREKYGISEIPIIFHDKPQGLSFFDRHGSSQHFDILGMCFFVLTRLEEYLVPRFDEFDRYPGIDSLAHQNKYLYMPIVDLYLDIFIYYLNACLGSCLESCTRYSTNVTCDVDNPFLFSRRTSGILKRAAADVILRRDMKSAIVSISGSLLPSRISRSFDPYSKGVDLIMDVNEQASNVVRFNFIPTVTDPRYDGFGGFPDEPIRSMLVGIKARGHAIGIHPGFNTYNSPENMCRSVDAFTLMQNNLSELEPVSGRQHYLRWRTGITEAVLNKSGIHADSTLSFADVGGFRCGTSKPFLLFDLVSSSETKVTEYPLIVMETTYFGKGYLNLRIDDVFSHMNEMKSWCKIMDGCFTVLWHNCGLQTATRREIYKQIINA